MISHPAIMLTHVTHENFLKYRATFGQSFFFLFIDLIGMAKKLLPRHNCLLKVIEASKSCNQLLMMHWSVAVMVKNSLKNKVINVKTTPYGLSEVTIIMDVCRIIMDTSRLCFVIDSTKVYVFTSFQLRGNTLLRILRFGFIKKSNLFVPLGLYRLVILSYRSGSKIRLHTFLNYPFVDWRKVDQSTWFSSC